MDINSSRLIDLDFDSHKQELISRIQSVYPGQWTDFASSNFGQIFLNIAAYSLATGAWTMNRLAGEMFVSTMTLQESAARVAWNYGIKVQSAQSATVLANITVDSTATQTAGVSIAKGVSVVASVNGTSLPFEFSSDVTIAQGSTQPSETVVIFNPSLAGDNIVQTFLTFVTGISYADTADISIDLSGLVEAGQVLEAPDDNNYIVQGLASSPGATGENRIYFTTPYTGVGATGIASVIENRVPLVQGQTINETYTTAAKIPDNYVIRLGKPGVVNSTTTVTINGLVWSEVPFIGVAPSTLQAFEVRLGPSGFSRLVFGDGVFGIVPPANAVVVVSYRIGGGLNGNVSAGSISATVSGTVINTTLSVPVQVTNPNSGGTGGSDPETVNEARSRIPAAISAQGRAVSSSDYASLSEGFTSPVFGKITFAMASAMRSAGLIDGNIVNIYAFTTGSNGTYSLLETSHKQALQDYLQNYAIVTDQIQVLDGTITPLPISLRFAVSTGFDVPTVTSQVIAALYSYVASLAPGDAVIYHSLVTLVGNVAGVDDVFFATPVNNVYPCGPDVVFSPVSDQTSWEDLDVSFNSSVLSAQSPVFPLQPWAFSLQLSGVPLAVLPGIITGTCVVTGAGVTAGSTVNLYNGVITLNGVTTGNLSFKLNPISGYVTTKPVNIYAAFSGNTSQSNRRQIRAALRAWADGFAIGSPIFAAVQSGISSSVSNAASVIANVGGVASVIQSVFERSGSESVKIIPASDELITLGNVYLNNEID